MRLDDTTKILTRNMTLAVQKMQLLHGTVTHHHVENMLFLVFSAPDGRIEVLIADSVSRIY